MGSVIENYSEKILENLQTRLEKNLCDDYEVTDEVKIFDFTKI